MFKKNLPQILPFLLPFIFYLGLSCGGKPKQEQHPSTNQQTQQETITLGQGNTLESRVSQGSYIPEQSEQSQQTQQTPEQSEILSYNPSNPINQTSQNQGILQPQITTDDALVPYWPFYIWHKIKKPSDYMVKFTRQPYTFYIDVPGDRTTYKRPFVAFPLKIKTTMESGSLNFDINNIPFIISDTINDIQREEKMDRYYGYVNAFNGLGEWCIAFLEQNPEMPVDTIKWDWPKKISKEISVGWSEQSAAALTMVFCLENFEPASYTNNLINKIFYFNNDPNLQFSIGWRRGFSIPKLQQQQTESQEPQEQVSDEEDEIYDINPSSIDFVPYIPHFIERTYKRLETLKNIVLERGTNNSDTNFFAQTKPLINEIKSSLEKIQSLSNSEEILAKCREVHSTERKLNSIIRNFFDYYRSNESRNTTSGYETQIMNDTFWILGGFPKGAYVTYWNNSENVTEFFNNIFLFNSNKPRYLNRRLDIKPTGKIEELDIPFIILDSIKIYQSNNNRASVKCYIKKWGEVESADGPREDMLLGCTSDNNYKKLKLSDLSKIVFN
jgi:hypothetical protein